MKHFINSNTFKVKQYVMKMALVTSSGTTVRIMKRMNEKDELDKIQNEAGRTAIGATKLISLTALKKEINWESLSERRESHKFTLFYKMKNQLTPDYLSSLVPPPVGATSRYNLRNSNSLQTVHARTKQYFYSFLPSTVRAWNSLSNNVKDVNSFKCNLKPRKTQTPKHFYSGSRRAQVLHTRLRTNCSSLSLDLFHRNITDSPLCRCGSIENNQHFFFHCRFYRMQRIELINTVRQYTDPSLQILLYGAPFLSVETNTKVFECVHKYILDTKRFQLHNNSTPQNLN